MKRELEICKRILGDNQTFLLTTHINPDGDGLGSELALARYLKSIGKHVTILNHDATPSQYFFLDREREIKRFNPSLDAHLFERLDVIWVLDANHLSRVGSLEPFIRSNNAFKVCLDHHLDPDDFADLYLLDDSIASTGQIVYQLLTDILGEKLPQDIAEPLYVAIMTDSGSFRFPKTDGALHRVIANLIDCGADPVHLYQQVYDQGTENRLRLLGMILAGVKTTHRGKVAYLRVTKEMLQETNTSEEDTENVINYTLTLADVQIGIMFTEMPNVIKLSFRSRENIWVNKLAQEFGGNGHKNAAGARVYDAESIDSVITKVLERAEAYVT